MAGELTLREGHRAGTAPGGRARDRRHRRTTGRRFNTRHRPAFPRSSGAAPWRRPDRALEFGDQWIPYWRMGTSKRGYQRGLMARRAERSARKRVGQAEPPVPPENQTDSASGTGRPRRQPLGLANLISHSHPCHQGECPHHEDRDNRRRADDAVHIPRGSSRVGNG
jgi:hypothetical protein